MRSALARLPRRKPLAPAERRALIRELSALHHLPANLPLDKLRLWRACRTDLAQFAYTFFPHLCSVPFSQMHYALFARDRATHGQRNLREATAAPRGSAKTTI